MLSIRHLVTCLALVLLVPVPTWADDAPAEADDDWLLEDARRRTNIGLVGDGRFLLHARLGYRRDEGRSTDGTIWRFRTVDGVASARYGLGERLEVSAAWPLGTSWQTDGADTSVARSTYLGEGSLRLAWAAVVEGARVPGLIASIEAQLPAPDGQFAGSADLLVTRTIDPVVLHASLRGTVSPVPADLARWTRPPFSGSAVIGAVLAMNEGLDLFARWSTYVSASATRGGWTMAAREAHTVQLGLSSWLAPRLSIAPSVGFSVGSLQAAAIVGLDVFVAP